MILLTITDDQNLGYALGAAEYLTKPVDWDRLGSILSRIRTDGDRRALVVDDDESARDIARRALERAGWRVREAENGRTALNALEQDAPSLIILALGGSRNGKSSTSPMRSDFMRRMTEARDERRISGSVISGRDA